MGRRPALALLLLLLLLAFLPGPALRAQEGSNSGAPAGEASGLPLSPGAPAPEVTPDERQPAQPGLQEFPEWDRLAERAEMVLETGRASNATLEQLRSEIAVWRQSFQDRQSENGSRIASVRAQIAALGPPPAEGQTEAPEIALRRQALEDTLARLDAPRRAAESAYSRADALIRGIDKLIRDRQAGELMQMGPTPLNPAHWPAALRELTGTVRAVVRETAGAWQNPVPRQDARNNAALILGLLGLAGLAFLRVPGWLRALARRITVGKQPPAVAAVDFLRSTLRMLIVAAGVFAVYQAMIRLNLLGYRGSLLLENLAALGMLLVVAGWLAGRTFPRGAEAAEPLHLAPPQRAEGRLHVLILATMLWGASFLRRLGEVEGWSPATGAVLQFPFLVVAGLTLFRTGRIILHPPGESAAPAQPVEFRRGLVALVGRVVSILGVVGPVLAAVGYMSAAAYLTVPAALSLALLALLVQLYGFLTQAYGVISRRSGAELDASLVPVLIGTLLALASLPLLALIWGARAADLSEIWLRLREGFSIGDTRVSPGMFLTLLLVFGVGYFLTRLVQGVLRTTVLPKTRIDTGGQTALVSGLGYLGIVLSALFAITTTGISLTSMAVVFGALSVGIGFGLQNVVQNFVAGIIMLVERPVAVGDWIEVGGNQGIVKQISVRSTRIETFDRSSVIVPNADFISGTVTNWTRDNLLGRITIPVGVAYGSDTRKVERILREIVADHPLVMLEPEPSVSFEDFGADALLFVIRAILPNVTFGATVKTELRHEIVRRFAEERIEIPFASRDVRIRDAGPLAQALGRAAGRRGPAGAPPPPAGALGPFEAQGDPPGPEGAEAHAVGRHADEKDRDR